MASESRQREDRGKRIHEDTARSDPVVMAIMTHQAEIASEDTRWIYEQFGDDVTTAEYLLRAATSD